MSVNEFYWFGVENGDTARENGFTDRFFFSNFAITNLLRNENATVTEVAVC